MYFSDHSYGGGSVVILLVWEFSGAKHSYNA